MFPKFVNKKLKTTLNAADNHLNYYLSSEAYEFSHIGSENEMTGQNV